MKYRPKGDAQEIVLRQALAFYSELAASDLIDNDEAGGALKGLLMDYGLTWCNVEDRYVFEWEHSVHWPC